jgi:hypothetical protein
MFERLQIGLIKRGFRKFLGKDIAPLKTLEAHPGVLIPYVRYTRALDKTKLVPAKLKVLAQVRAAKLVECPF